MSEQGETPEDQGGSDRLPLAGRWIKIEQIAEALAVRHSILIESAGGELYEVSETLLERLLTAAGYTLEEGDAA